MGHGSLFSLGRQSVEHEEEFLSRNRKPKQKEEEEFGVGGRSLLPLLAFFPSLRGVPQPGFAPCFPLSRWSLGVSQREAADSSEVGLSHHQTPQKRGNGGYREVFDSEP